MRWSVSGARVFAQCPRKWYYQTLYADPKSADPVRREAEVLSKLQSIHAWRGKLVDQVISTFVVPKFNSGIWVEPEKALSYAEWLMDRQLAYGRSKAYRNNGLARANGDFCAFFELEYGNSLAEEAVNRAKEEVKASLTNLYASKLMSDIREGAVRLVAQRPLQFPFADMTVICTPDLIAFFKDRNPMIVDWKVEAPAYKEHWLQLGSYGLALSKVNPHSDFPQESHDRLKDPSNTGLVEFQLLRNRQQEYHMTPDDVVEIEDFMYTSIERIQTLLNGRKPAELRIEDFPTARFPTTCMRCNFRKICWKEGEQTC